MTPSLQHASRPDSTTAPAVVANQLIKHFGELEVLKGISLEVHEGTVTSIIGASGSGKSTLLRCMNLLERPDRGELAIADEAIRFARNPQGDIIGLDRRQLQRLRAKVAMVFQQFNLWPHLTVLGNVIEAPMRVKKLPRKQATALGEHYLERVGMADRRDAYPAFLSGGQQQRVAIARALVNEPTILLADEPTGNLDTRTGIEIMEIFQQLNEGGMTLVMVTHEPEIGQYVKRRVFMRDGRIVADDEVDNRVDAAEEKRRLAATAEEEEEVLP